MTKSFRQNGTKKIPTSERLILALDVPSQDEAKRLVTTLKSHVTFYKIGWELFMTGWFDIVDWIVQQDLKVMLDLKFFDIANTVAGAVSSLSDHGITFATAHGNYEILKAAVKAKNEVQILAVTVLTSLSESDLMELGYNCKVEDLVLSRAKQALELGCHGVIASGLEVARLREELGEDFLILVPGVRPGGYPDDDQKRVVTVEDALVSGADHVIIGRPIIKASTPIDEVKRVHEEIERTLQNLNLD